MREQAEVARYARGLRESDSAVLDRLLAMLHDLSRREQEAVLAGCSFRDEAHELREILAEKDREIERLRRALNGDFDA